MRTSILCMLAVCATAVAGTYFPTDLETSQWKEFQPKSYQTVTGVVYDKDTVTCCSVPMGGVATGCIDVDMRGVWGYSSIFNAHEQFHYIPHGTVPRISPTIEPILGLSVGGQTWALALQEFIGGGNVGWCTEPHHPGVWTSDPKPRVKQIKALNCPGVKPATNIKYWGHYPVADFEFETDAPVQVGMRAWSPFLPGQTVESNIPATVFEVELRNTTGQSQKGTLVFNFPGPNKDEAMGTAFTRKELSGKLNGLLVKSNSAKVSYVLGVIGNESVRTGAGLNVSPDAWSKIAQELPQAEFFVDNDVRVNLRGSASVAVDFELKANQEKTVRYVLAWYSPTWKGVRKAQPNAQPTTAWHAPEWMGDTLYYEQMYGLRFTGAYDVAMKMTEEHESLLKRIIAWQNVVYTDSKIPGWLQDSLINILHLIPESGYWAQPKSPVGDWAFPHGVYVMNESSRGCPHASCIPCDWYGDIPLAYFYPDLSLYMLRAFKQYQRPDGEIPFALGKIHGMPDCTTPEYYWQKSLNSMCYIDLVDRLWMTTGDDAILKEFYESVKKANTYTVNLSTKPGRPIRMPDDGGMEWFEHGEWAGMATHMGGLRLAMLEMAERMAQKMNDKVYADQCRQWLDEGQDAMENKMWAGSYYLNFWEPETGKKSEDVMAYQLDGQWTALAHGLEGVFKTDRVSETLETIKRVNIPLTPDVGAANFAKPDGEALSRKTKKTQENINEVTDADIAHYGSHTMFVAEAVLLGMTYMYDGQYDFGLEFVRKHWANLVCKQRHPWDMPNMVDGSDGRRLFGTDYTQAMMLWAMPAAIYQTDLSGPAQEEGLVAKMIKAAEGE